MRRVQAQRAQLLHALDLAVADAAGCFGGCGFWCDAGVFAMGGCVCRVTARGRVGGDVVELGGADLQAHAAELLSVVSSPDACFGCEVGGE